MGDDPGYSNDQGDYAYGDDGSGLDPGTLILGEDAATADTLSGGDGYTQHVYPDGTTDETIDSGAHLVTGPDGKSQTAYNPDGTVLETKGYDGATRFIDPHTGVQTVTMPDGTVVTINPDGSSTTTHASAAAPESGGY